MFQYAAIRSTAEKLDVPFYCPPWPGDEYFQLNDEHIRVKQAAPSYKMAEWRQPSTEAGYTNLFKPSDNTDYYGHFISPQYFISQNQVKTWFTFNTSLVNDIETAIDVSRFNRSTAIHIRLGDYLGNPNYYIPSSKYYKRAISYLNAKTISVFSDQPELAKTLLKDVQQHCTFIERNEAVFDLFLLTRCRNIVIAPSTFSWWGAFLNTNPQRQVICPKEGLTRPGSQFKISQCYPSDWVRISASLGLFGSVRGQAIKSKFMRLLNSIAISLKQ